MFREILFFFLSFATLGVNLVPGAPSASELLEEAVYLEESVGDLEGALAIYDRIIEKSQAERRYVAQALLRKGGCHLERGEEELALGAFRALVEGYPDQPDLVALAREHLPEPAEAEEPEPAEPELLLDPAPWEDGELLRYTLSAPSHGVVGDMTFSMTATRAGGKAAWRIENRFLAPGGEVSKLSWVEAEAETLRPIRAFLRHSQLGTASIEYVEHERRMMVNRPGEEPEPFEHRIDGEVFENEQAHQIVRRLPLRVGFEHALVFAGRPGAVATAYIRVQGRESVTVPAGTFDCFRLTISLPPVEEVHWITADEHRYPVMVDNPEATIKLREITRLARGPRTLRSEKAGFELTVPEGWDAFESAFSFGFPELVFQLFSPEMRGGALLLAEDRDAAPSVGELAEKDVGIYRSRRESYRVREKSWTELSVAGRPAVAFVADLEMGGVPYAEYRVYIEGERRYYWFVFRDRKDPFEDRRDDFEEIVGTFRTVAR
jgi:hypothetical protein